VLAFARNEAAHPDPAARDHHRVALWEVRTRRERGSFDAGAAESLAFHPSGGVLAVSYPDRIEPRDAGTGALLQTRRSQRSAAARMAFSSDGRLLAVADGGPEVVLWDLDEGRWRQTLCELVDRGLTDAERRRFLPGGPAEPTCEG
jgi:WD40 repeat protein